MTSVQERLKVKRTSYDTWSTREQLCLASSVLKSGDQNWISVSRSLKPFAEKEALRPSDWFSQKSCAVQYAHLLENADTPKRKKRDSGETTGESIVRRLTQERIAELGQILAFQRDEYQQLKAEVNLLRSGSASEERLQKMWFTVEQEEREQERKARAHNAWLVKRQQKQETLSSQTASVGTPRKLGENSTAEGQEAGMNSFADDDDRKNRGGRSPLLTSLLKSPSPTTQIQAPTHSTQVGTPTIASLLGSSPKVPNSQLTQSVSPQLHQLVSTAIASATAERPSVGAPTLSMLLELPANTQRGPLPNLQTASTGVARQNLPADIRVQPLTQAGNQAISQNVVHVVQTPPIDAAPSIPVTESMVQIIDHIDNVIRKDIMADVIDKDEINEIIGDIEELIKEEITGSPRTLDATAAAASIVEGMASLSQSRELVPGRQRPRDIDEPVSLSNSPQSEMAIEEIDSSTSNIAEIIGTVAIESTEPKVIVDGTPPGNVSNVDEELKSETNDTTAILDDKLASEGRNNEIPEEGEGKVMSVEAEQTTIERRNSDREILETVVAIDSKESKCCTDVTKVSTTDVLEEETAEDESKMVVSDAKDDSCDGTRERNVSSKESDSKRSVVLDQLEMHLAKITGEQQDATSEGEVASVSSEITNNLPSVEDAEKSQDISLILEDDESLYDSQDKNDTSIGENAAESAESVESFKEKEGGEGEGEGAAPRDDAEMTTAAAVEAESGPVKGGGQDAKDSSEDTGSSIPEVKEEDASEATVTVEGSSSTVATEEFQSTKRRAAEDDIIDKDRSEVTATVVKSEDKRMVEESRREEKEMKEEEEEEEEEEVDVDELILKKEIAESAGSTGDDVGELDEEESALSKLGGGRVMKTYSKKQTVVIDSEPENEGGGEGADYRAWKKAVMLVYNRLATHKYASVFLRPITEDQAPGYHSVIFRPMDLSTVKKNIDNGTIRSTMHFQRDVMLMFQNAIMYNKQDTFVYKMAISMQEECLQHMQILVQVTGEGPPFRRETRTAASGSNEAVGDAGTKRKRSHITPSPHDTDAPRTKKRRKSEND